MSKKVNSKGFFKSSDIKLNREVKQAREVRAKESNKGFVGELNRADKRSVEYRQAKEKGQSQPNYWGQEVVERKAEIKVDRSLDPSQQEKDSPEKGFEQQLNWNYLNPKNR